MRIWGLFSWYYLGIVIEKLNFMNCIFWFMNNGVFGEMWILIIKYVKYFDICLIIMIVSYYIFVNYNE